MKKNIRWLILQLRSTDNTVYSYVERLMAVFEPQVAQTVILGMGAEIAKLRGEHVTCIQAENPYNAINALQIVASYPNSRDVLECDEVVYVTDDVMGILPSFGDEWDQKIPEECDYWGLFRQGEAAEIYPGFICFRRSFLSSGKFRDSFRFYTYKARHEDVETIASRCGLRGSVLCDTKWIMSYNTKLSQVYPQYLMKELGCPIFCRSAFDLDYRSALGETTGEALDDLVMYLRSIHFDVDVIWQYLLKAQNQADICKKLHLTYVLDRNACAEPMQSTEKIALVMHLYYMDLLPEVYQYASSMPTNTDVYITTNSIENKCTIEAAFSGVTFRLLEVRVIENRGRDVSSILVGVKDVVDQYDYVCFMHDKKTMQIKPGSVGKSFAYILWENMLCTPGYVKNILDLFRENPRLGLLSPPAPNHADYYPVIGFEWSINFAQAKSFMQQRGFSDKYLDETKEPIAPLGTCFWFRPKAMKALYDMDWQYEDFPPEPNETDGTLLHVMERLYPIFVQNAGYYPALVMNADYARLELTNLRHYVRDYNIIAIMHGFAQQQNETVAELRRRMDKR